MTSDPTSSSLRKPLRIAVIGGGITGLAAAHRIIELCESQSHQPLSLTVFEKTPRVGGVFGSEQIGDYLIERGADSFITNKPAALNLCQRLGLESELISTNPRYRRSLILFRGKPVPTPVGFNLLAPARIWPMLTTPLLSWRGKLRLLGERFVPRKTGDDEESLSQFVRRRLGDEMLERIVQPMVGGIYTSDPDRLSLKATLPRFLEMEQKYGSLTRGMARQRKEDSGQDGTQAASGARYGLFVSLKNGMQQLLDTLEQRIARQTGRRTGPEVSSLVREEDVWKITTGHGQTLEFDGVILALPARGSASLLQQSAPDCSELLSKIEAASSAIVVTGHDLSNFRHPLDAFGLVIPHAERRRILAASFLSRKFDGRAPDGKILIRTFVGGAMQPEEYDQSDSELVDTVLGELRSIFGGQKSDPEVVLVNRYPQGMPQYTIGHLHRVAEIQHSAEQIPQLQLAGNYFYGVGIPDCVESGERAAEKLLATLIR